MLSSGSKVPRRCTHQDLQGVEVGTIGGKARGTTFRRAGKKASREEEGCGEDLVLVRPRSSALYLQSLDSVVNQCLATLACTRSTSGKSSSKFLLGAAMRT